MTHVCYDLGYETEWGHKRIYHGITRVLARQTREQAAEKRMEKHITDPVTCLQHGVASSFKITPVGHLMSEDNCLLQEVINTARGLSIDSTTRGACFACEPLGAKLRNLGAAVRAVVKGLAGQQAREALRGYADTLDSDHPLVCHLAKKDYRQNKQGFSGPKLAIVLPTEYKARRSGVSGDKQRDKQLDREDYEYGSDQHRRLKRGRDPVQRVADSNARQRGTTPGGKRVRA
jgi:hypothetical protein